MARLRTTTRLLPKMRVTSESVLVWVRLFARNIDRSEKLLTDLDRAIGDGDHGVNMRRGMQAVIVALDEFTPPDLAGSLRSVSLVLTSSVGGASGALYGTFFLHASRAVLSKSDLSLLDLATLVEAGCQGVVQLGKAAVGDKTMVDTLSAAVASLRASCARRELLPQAVAACVRATRHASLGTIPMVAKKGRASYLGERSAGHQDPGAASAHLLFEALAETLLSRSFTSTPQIAAL
jgi:dihydroxyacetone kinase-like protein